MKTLYPVYYEINDIKCVHKVNNKAQVIISMDSHRINKIIGNILYIKFITDVSFVNMFILVDLKVWFMYTVSKSYLHMDTKFGKTIYHIRCLLLPNVHARTFTPDVKLVFKATCLSILISVCVCLVK